jgi:hypothetical protein
MREKIASRPAGLAIGSMQPMRWHGGSSRASAAGRAACWRCCRSGSGAMADVLAPVSEAASAPAAVGHPFVPSFGWGVLCGAAGYHALLMCVAAAAGRRDGSRREGRRGGGGGAIGIIGTPMHEHLLCSGSRYCCAPDQIPDAERSKQGERTPNHFSSVWLGFGWLLLLLTWHRQQSVLSATGTHVELASELLANELTTTREGIAAAEQAVEAASKEATQCHYNLARCRGVSPPPPRKSLVGGGGGANTIAGPHEKSTEEIAAARVPPGRANSQKLWTPTAAAAAGPTVSSPEGALTVDEALARALQRYRQNEDMVRGVWALATLSNW